MDVIKSLDQTTRLINERIEQFEFSHVLACLRPANPSHTIYAFVRQPKLTGGEARLEQNGHLIYPFLSVVMVKGETIRLASVPSHEQAQLLEVSLTSQTEFASDFSVVRGSESDRPLLKAIHELLHAYFVAYELDKVIERSAFKLMQAGSQTNLPFYERQAILINTNATLFGIDTIQVNIDADDQFRISSNNSELDEVTISNVLRHLIKEVTRLRISVSESLVVDGETIYFHAIPTTRARKKKPEIVVISSKGKRLSTIAVKLNEAIVDLNRETFTRKPKTLLERELQKKIIDLKSNPDSVADFQSFCRGVLEQLGKITNSHSITIRQYVPFTDSLDLVSGWALDRAQDNTLASIPRDAKGSVNAFCYDSPDESYIYLPDLSDIPKKYALAGLESPLRARTNSASEICIPIGVHPIRLGTLNLESPNFAAFELDIGFLERIAFLLSQYWSSITSAGDTWWLSQLSLTHLATHELRDFKEQLNPDQKKILQGIIETIAPTEHYTTNKDLTWIHFFKYLQRAHSKLLACPYHDIWTTEGIVPHEPISSRFLGSLRLIVQCILNNTKHSDYRKNQIFLAKRIVGGKEIVSIEYRSMVNYFDPDTISEIERRFMQPSLSSDGWHFGLFLIGVHARLLGGDVTIDPACRREFGYAPFSYIVRFPIPEANNDQNSID